MNIDKITKSDKLFLENHKEQIIKNDWKHLIRDLLSNYSEYDVLRILKVFRKANVAINTGDLFKSSGYIVYLFMQIIDRNVGVVQMVRTSVCDTEGWEFEFLRPPHICIYSQVG